jgi:hypothetical protein
MEGYLMNTSYNPIFRATRAAWTELTTPQAWRWYAQQLQTSAALAYQGLTRIRRWLNESRGQSAVVPVQRFDSTAIESAQVSAQPETTASELGGIPAAWNAIEANPIPTATPSEQAIAVAETQAPAADLAHEPESLHLATIEPDTSLDYELLDEPQERPTGTNGEPLSEVETPFSDDLESGPPYLPEEEDSFFDPEEDSSDSLLEDDLEPVASELPSDLDARIQAFMQARGISTEADDSSSHHSPTPASNYSSTGAEFGL